MVVDVVRARDSVACVNTLLCASSDVYEIVRDIPFRVSLSLSLSHEKASTLLRGGLLHSIVQERVRAVCAYIPAAGTWW